MGPQGAEFCKSGHFCKDQGKLSPDGCDNPCFSEKINFNKCFVNASHLNQVVAELHDVNLLNKVKFSNQMLPPKKGDFLFSSYLTANSLVFVSFYVKLYSQNKL